MIREGVKVKRYTRRASTGLAAVSVCALLLAGCAGRGAGGGASGGVQRLERVARETAGVEKIEGRGKARVENRLGEIEIEFTMVYEPGVLLKLDGDLAPGFLPFHGDFEITSTPETTLAYVNGVPLVPDRATYPGRTVYPALVAVVLGGDYVLGWLSAQGCEVGEKVAWGRIDYELDLDEETGHIKAWTLRHEDPDGSYDGFLYKSRPQGLLELPEILTGMAHPYEVGLYVEYYQISATIK